MSPVLDDIKNVDLITAVENTTHTVIEFQRALNTGDTAHDIPITVSQFLLCSGKKYI